MMNKYAMQYVVSFAFAVAICRLFVASDAMAMMMTMVMENIHQGEEIIVRVWKVYLTDWQNNVQLENGIFLCVLSMESWQL